MNNKLGEDIGGFSLMSGQVSDFELSLFQNYLDKYLLHCLDNSSKNFLLWGFNEALSRIPERYLSRIKVYSKDSSSNELRYPRFQWISNPEFHENQVVLILSKTYFFEIYREIPTEYLHTLHIPNMAILEKIVDIGGSEEGYFIPHNKREVLNKTNIDLSGIRNLNLGSGVVKIPNYLGVDLCQGCDYQYDILTPLPFNDGTIDNILLSHVLEHFSKKDGLRILKECFRVLSEQGVIRASVPDFNIFVQHAYQENREFFYEQVESNGITRDRFEGDFISDKFMYVATGSGHKEFYSWESLSKLFIDSGFNSVVKRDYKQGKLFRVEEVDNRQNQSLFLEASKT